ncbi:MAG: DUF6941 family protein [Candidatus Dormibacterales bacterium]
MPGPARLTAMFVADHAEAVGGKLYVTGGCWDRLTAPQLPAVHPHLSLAITLSLPAPRQTERRRLEVRLLDPQGHDCLGGAVRSEFEVASPVDGADAVPVLLVLNFNALQLAHAGRYDFTVHMDGDEIGRTGFLVSSTTRRATAD